MEKLRVAMISYHTCPLATEEGGEIGGLNTFVLELSKELTRQGIVVDIFTRSQSPNDPQIVNVRNNLRVIHLKAGPRRIVLKKHLIRYLPEFVKNYQNFVKKNNLHYDLFHCHYYLSGLIGIEIRKNSQTKPVVMSFHTLALMKNLVARDELEKEEVKRIEAEYILCKSVDKIIAPSKIDAQYLSSLYSVVKEKIKILPPGVDLKRFRPLNKNSSRLLISAPNSEKIILFVARIEPLKGLDMLLYAIKLLNSRNPSLKFMLYVVGGKVSKNPEKWSKHLKVILQLRQVLGLSKIVKFVGQKPQSKLPYYYNSGDLLVMPSHYESFGMVALEAMACRLPIIASNVAGVSSVIPSTYSDLITTVNNPLQLSHQIEKLLTDEEKRKSLAADLYAKVPDFSWKITTSKIIEVYKSLVSRQGLEP